MIARQVAMQSVKKSDFASLVRYLTDTQNKNERVGCVTITNCRVDQAAQVDAAILEVLNTQAQNTRARSDRTYHLIVSFRAGEQPEEKSLKAIEARLCAGLGYDDHQRVSAVHHDTDNLHIHIAINKIHPSRYTLHEPYNDYTTLGQLCDKLEIEFDLAKDNHEVRQRGGQSRAFDMEMHAGVESLLGWIQRECFDQIKEAQSWSQLHQAMQANSLALRERGNGLVIVAEDGTAVKASSVGRDYSKNKLEARFGPFEPSTKEHPAPSRPKPDRRSGDRPATAYAPEPMLSGIDTATMFVRYQAERQAGSTLRRAEWAQAIDRKTRLVDAAKRSGRLKRAAIKLIKLAGPGKKLLYAGTSRTLKDDLQAISHQYLKERQQIHAKHRYLAWADWLRAQASEGDPQALSALRARAASQGLTGNTVSGKPGQKPLRTENVDNANLAEKGDVTPDSLTKQGTIIYCVGTTAVRDDGTRLKVSRGASQEGLQAALQMAMVRYGRCLTVNGTAAFKEQIAQAAASAQLPVTFDDVALERRRQALLQRLTTAHQPEQARSNTIRTSSVGSDRGEPDKGRIDSSRPTGAGFDASRDNASAVRGGSLSGKPNIGRVGSQPPPQGQNRLRGLSELGVIQLTGLGEVLLPGNAPGHVEPPRAHADDTVQPAASTSAVRNAGQIAASEYIAEREKKRLHGMDVLKHSHYAVKQAGVVTFAGMRQVGGQTLALLQRQGDILVLPIDGTEAARLKSVGVGTALRVTPQGIVKKKGRSR